jgi:hypothetical protein
LTWAPGIQVRAAPHAALEKSPGTSIEITIASSNTQT